eukprot:7597080-Heterocapsa_arctica.AAC.1
MYVRTPSRATWLLYDSELCGSSIHFIGQTTWNTGFITQGQHDSANHARQAYANVPLDDWPCNTQTCPSCLVVMPTGFT